MIPYAVLTPKNIKADIPNVPESPASLCGWVGATDVTGLLFVHDGAQVVTFDRFGFRVWDAHDGSAVHFGADPVLSAESFSTDGQWLVVHGGTETSLVRTSDWQEVRRWAPSLPSAVALSADGSVMAYSEDQRGIISLADTADSSVLASLEDHSQRVRALAFSPDGNLLASAAEGEVFIWSAKTHQLLAQYADTDLLQPIGLHFSSDSQYVLESTDGGPRVFLASDASLLPKLDPDEPLSGPATVMTYINHILDVTPAGVHWGEQDALASSAGLIALSRDGSTLAAAEPGFVAVESVDTGAVTWQVDSGAPNADGKRLTHIEFRPLTAVTSSEILELTEGHGELRALAADGRTVLRQGETNLNVLAVEFFKSGPDAGRVAFVNVDSSIDIWNWNALVHVDDAGPYTTQSLTFSEDGNWLVLAMASGSVNVRSSVDGTSTASFNLESNPPGLMDALILPDDDTLVGGGFRLSIASIRQARVKQQFAIAGQLQLASLALSPDHRTIAACSSEGTLSLISTADWSVSIAQKAHNGGACQVAFTKSGNSVLTFGHDRELRRWRASDATLIDTQLIPDVGAIVGTLEENGADRVLIDTASGSYLFCLPTK
jgi:WD40 repeat protein